MFGVANQLLGMLALCVGTTIIIKIGKIKYIWTTLIPMVFMSVITLTAAHQLFWGFIKKAWASNNPAEAFTLRLDATLMGIMAFLSVVIVIDSVIKWYEHLKKVGSRQ